MRLELVKLQESIGVSFIMVTHDQSEALAMADRVAVLEDGQLRQLASPSELYHKPNNAFVADFIGSVNFFDLTRTETRAETNGGEMLLETKELGEMVFPLAALPSGHGDLNDLRLAIRPEKVKVNLTMPTGGNIRTKGKLGDVAFQGESSIIELILDTGRSISAFIHESEADPLLDAEIGADVWLTWDAADMLILPRKAR